MRWGYPPPPHVTEGAIKRRRCAFKQVALALCLVAPSAAHAADSHFEDLLSQVTDTGLAGHSAVRHYFEACGGPSVGGDDALEQARCEGRGDAARQVLRLARQVAWSPMGVVDLGRYDGRRGGFRATWSGELGDIPFSTAARCAPVAQTVGGEVSFPFWPFLTRPASAYFCEEPSQDTNPMTLPGPAELVVGAARRWPSRKTRRFFVPEEDAMRADRLKDSSIPVVQSVVRVLRHREGWAVLGKPKPGRIKKKPRKRRKAKWVQVWALETKLLGFRVVDLATGRVLYSDPPSRSPWAFRVDTESVGDADGEAGEGAGPLEKGGESRPAVLKEAPELTLPEGEISPRRPKEVEVIADLDEEGYVSEVNLGRGAGEPWDSHALDLALDLVYEPALVDGKSVPARVRWTAVFR